MSSGEINTVSIFGLGYVGSVTAACLASAGFRIVGVDSNPLKVDMLNAGRAPVVEDGLAELMGECVGDGLIRATTDAADAVAFSDISLICVGTPSRANGSLDLSYVLRVAEEIGAALASKRSYHVVVARSTMLPGSTEDIVIPALERASGRRAGEDFGVCFNPEFLREGSSISDFRNPAYTVIGGNDERATALVGSLYSGVAAPRFVVPFRVAEMVKYASNAFHALKVVFANEIGAICKESGIDSHQVMDLFTRDTKLNASAAYLRPGFAFGGSCLPKDLRALLHHSHSRDVFPPVLESILTSNRRQVETAYELITRTGKKRVGVLGFSFKAGTDDLRESPLVDLIERLLGRGFDVTVYDRNVRLANLQGSNRAYIEGEIPHIARHMVSSLDEVLEYCDVIVIGNGSPEFRDVPARLRDGQRVVDLVRVPQTPAGDRYEGIAW
jgi:GDP-mannose 6-dehydrogenase